MGGFMGLHGLWAGNQACDRREHRQEGRVRQVGAAVVEASAAGRRRLQVRSGVGGGGLGAWLYWFDNQGRLLEKWPAHPLSGNPNFVRGDWYGNGKRTYFWFHFKLEPDGNATLFFKGEAYHMFDFDHTGADQVITLEGGGWWTGRWGRPNPAGVRQCQHRAASEALRRGMPQTHRQSHALLKSVYFFQEPPNEESCPSRIVSTRRKFIALTGAAAAQAAASKYRLYAAQTPVVAPQAWISIVGRRMALLAGPRQCWHQGDVVREGPARHHPHRTPRYSANPGLRRRHYRGDASLSPLFRGTWPGTSCRSMRSTPSRET